MQSKLVVTAATLLLVVACNDSTSYGGNGGEPCPPTAPQVCMRNTAFEPVIKTVNVGTTLVWKNTDPVTHTTTSNTSNSPDCPAWNQTVGAGQTSSGVTFGTALLTCDYHCSIHSAMLASVRVK